MAFNPAEIPGWIGFLALIVIGFLMAIHGLFNPFGADLDRANTVGFSTFGLAVLAIGAFSWIAGATSKVVPWEGRGRVRAVVRVAITDLPWWAWVVNVALLVVAIIIFFALTS